MSQLVQSHQLLVPEQAEVRTVIQKGLEGNFANVEVAIVDCPDLKKEPYNFAASGFCGSPRVAEVGGIPNLLPLADTSKNYDFDSVAKMIGLPNAYMVGAGAGPHELVGVNSEMIGDVVTGDNPANKSKVALMDEGKCVLKDLSLEQRACSLMFNIYASEGKPGKVLRIKASKRTGDENFATCIRKSLTEHYGTSAVALGGFFSLLSGSARCHVMPCFSKNPLKTGDDVNKWLEFIDMAAPMHFMSVLVSSDPGLDLRLEHSHGYGKEVGGHYHYDVTPEDVSYEGYYNIAETLFRVDACEKTWP